ncbi:MAG TPA: glycosyl hydrolase 115 family protein, partial [Chitinophagaceae bacterium]|nr:glycosyl hydrolase 115 family protein [Chitinophagaceae bacterium]
TKAKGNVIVIGAIQSSIIQKIVGGQSAFSKKLIGKWESFGLTVVDKPLAAVSKAFVIAGSDARGTAYGVFTLSEKLGVSPWSWWADVPVKQQKELVIHQREFISSPPAVQYRGIFINDEDWGLQPWAAKTFEPETGDIGPKTYAKVFELLLRLKANMIWPAMHPSTKAFFHYPGNVKTAGDYQIMIGSSHAEPMLRNNVGEWDHKTMGHFNYFTNKERVLKYWEDRIKESSGINAIYTLGMRGIHDGQMEGVKDLKEAVPVVERIIGEERELLSKYINNDVTQIPQVLTPYKEVLDIYDNGLKVPDDVTLVWPDDNYGYIHRLNNEKEVTRRGRSGVYYHASYWGRPHDYLWLPSTHPSLVREEMMKAYETGADRLWVLNVGDIKPQEYNMQQFLDMAYDPAPFKDSRYTKQHLLNWITSIFGKEKGQKIQSILWEYYQLAFERRSEFMGWSQTEPTTKTTHTAYNHFYFGDEAQKRIDRYNALEADVKKLRQQIKRKDADAFYQLVYYPVVGASWINKKFLYRDKAYLYGKQNRLSAYEYARLSMAAYDSIVKETEYFNTQVAAGKWKYVMSMNPRNLPVYQPPVLPEISIDSTTIWSIAPEGYVTKDSSLLGDNDFMSLPSFDNLNKQQYFVDIFLSKNETIKWTAITSHNWIRLSKNSGVLGPEQGKKQMRIWVDIDWAKLKKNEKMDGSVAFIGGDKKIVVNLRAIKIYKPELTGYKGFIENNGFVSIRAANFTRQANKTANQWKVISDFGYTGEVLQAFPLSMAGNALTEPDSIKGINAVVEYDFYTLTPATPFVTVFALPTHPINNNYSCRYAVSIDEGPLKMVDVKTFGRSEEWKQNVLRNRAEKKIDMPHLNAGKHTLKIYCVDPGVILDEIRIDLGGLKKAYSVIPETRMTPASQSAF